MPHLRTLLVLLIALCLAPGLAAVVEADDAYEPDDALNGSDAKPIAIGETQTRTLNKAFIPFDRDTASFVLPARAYVGARTSGEPFDYQSDTTLQLFSGSMTLLAYSDNIVFSDDGVASNDNLFSWVLMPSLAAGTYYLVVEDQREVGDTVYYLHLSATAIAPTFGVAAGSFDSPQSLELESLTEGAEIRYTTDGSTPTLASTLYAGALALPIDPSGTTTVKAIAYRAGYAVSSVSTATYTFTVANPVITPAQLLFTEPGPQTITLASATPGAELRYTTDGSTPTAASTLYAGPFTVASSTTIRVRGLRAGFLDSAVSSSAFVFRAATPSFSPGSGIYAEGDPVSVTIASASTGAEIRYTTDGSTPTAASTLYAGPVAVTPPTVLKAIAIVAGLEDSQVGTAVLATADSSLLSNPLSLVFFPETGGSRCGGGAGLGLVALSILLALRRRRSV